MIGGEGWFMCKGMLDEWFKIGDVCEYVLN